MDLKPLYFASFFIICTSFLLPLYAQTPSQNPTRKIEVTGSAEMEVTPDEIYVTIGLQEFYRDNKKKVSIETLEQNLQKAVMKAGIPAENFTIENVHSYNWNWEKKKTDEFMAKKQYRLKLTSLGKINEIVSKVDSKGIESMNISSYSHSKIEQYKRDLKLQALQVAKEKAAFLLRGIGENLGQVIEIQEFNEGYNPPMSYQLKSNHMMEASMDMQQPEIDFKTIKLRYEMRAVFQIAEGK